MPSFTSDNVTSACPEVMDAVIAANAGVAASYGDDQATLNLQTRLGEIFETDVIVFPAVTGTASNALALAALTPSYGKIYCNHLAHINTDECGAPELFTAGAKIIPIPGIDGKITAEQLGNTICGRGNVHHAQPASVSITQATEAGTVYQVDEIAAITEVAHQHGLKVHMDGARFTNALVTLGVTPAEMTWKAGVDVLTFGGTKNGCLAAEAIVFFKPELAQNFAYTHKRSGQLLSKMRFISSQYEGYLNNDVWYKNARQANAMAARLSVGFSKIDGIELAYPTQSNEVFVKLPESIVNSLKQQSYDVNEDELDGTAARFVAAWNTTEEAVDQLLSAAAK